MIKQDSIDIQQVLYDFNTTLLEKGYGSETMMSKFPEFNNDKELLQAAYDYSATLNSGKYKTIDELNSKFPEFFHNSIPSEDIEKPSLDMPKESVSVYKAPILLESQESNRTDEMSRIPEVDLQRELSELNGKQQKADSEFKANVDAANKSTYYMGNASPLVHDNSTDMAVDKILDVLRGDSYAHDNVLNKEEKQRLVALQREDAIRKTASAFSSVKENSRSVSALRKQGEDNKYLDIADELNTKSMKIITAPKNYDSAVGIVNWAEGLGETLNDKDIYTSGITELVRAGNLSSIAKKLNAEEDITESESLALEAYINYGLAQEARVNDLSLGYKIGQATAQSLPFMVEMLVTAGLGSVGKKFLVQTLVNKGKRELAEKIAKYLGGTEIKEVIGKGIGKGIAKKVEYGTTKTIGGKILKEGVETVAQTAVMPHTWVGVENDKLETILNGDEYDFLDFMRSFTDAVQETFTERAGGKMIEKGLSKVLPFEKMWNHRIAGRTVSNDIIQSPLAETSEEYLGAIMDFIRSYNPLYSDQSNRDKRAGADEMFTGEGFAVTAGSVLPMSIFGGVSNSVKIHNTASKFRSAKSDLTNYLQQEGVFESDCRNIIKGIESSDNGIDFVNKCNIVYRQLDAQWLQQHPDASLEEAKQHQKELSAIIKNYLSKAFNYDESVQDINLRYSKLTDEERAIIDGLFFKSLQKQTPSKASVKQDVQSPEPNSASEPSVSIPEGDDVSAVVSIKNTDGSVSVLQIQSFDGFEYDADGAIDLRATAEKHTASITINGEKMTLKDALSSNLISSESEAMTTKSYYDQQRAVAEQANKAEAQQRAAAEQAKQAEAAAPKIDEVPIGTNEQVFATTLEDGVVEMGESRDEQGNIVYFKSEGKANDAINKLKKKSFFSNYDFELVPVQVGTRGTGVYAEPVNVYKIAAKARQETSEVVEPEVNNEEPEVNNEESSSSPVEETSVAYWRGEPVEMVGEVELDGRVYMRVRLGNDKEKLVTKDNLFDSGGVQLYPKEKKQKPVDYLKGIGSREADISGISEQLLSKYGAEIAEEVVRDSYAEAIDKRYNAKGALQRGDARIEAENWKLVGRAMGIELGEDLEERNKNNNIVEEKENDNGIRTTIDTESQRGIQVEDEKQRAYADRERQETKEFSEPITANTPQSDVYEDDVTSLLPKEDADNYRAAVLSSDIETLNGFYIRALNGADKTKSELDAKRAELDEAVDIIDKVLINKDLKKLEKRLINERALYTGLNNKIQEIKKQIHNGEAAVEVAPQTTPSDVRVSEPEATTLSDLQDFGRLTAAHYSEERESRYNRMAAELGEPPLKGESSFKSSYTEEKSEPVKPTTTTYYEPKNAFFPEEKAVSSGNSSLSVLDNALDNEDASGVRMAKKSKDNKRSGDRVYVVYDISEGVPRGYEAIDSDCEIAYRDNETAGVFSRVGDKTVLLDTSGKLVTGSLELYTDNEGVALGKSRIRSNANKLLNADTVQASLDKQLVTGKDAQGNPIRVSISDLLTKDYEIDDEYRDAVKTELVKSVGIINSTLRRNGFDTLLDSDFSTRGKHTNTAVRQNASKRKRNSDIISAIKSSGDIEFSIGNGTLTGANELSSEEAEIESEDIRFLIKKDLVGDGVLRNLAEKYWDSGIAAVVNNAKSIEGLNEVLDNLSDGIVEHYMEKRARINPKRARAEVATVQNTNPREMAAAANSLGVVYQVDVNNYSDEDIKIMITPVEEELTKSRKSIGNKWNDILKNYSSAERFIVLKSLYQFISKQSEAYPIGYIQQPFEETMREFKESGSPATFNFYQSYNENIINYIGEDKNAVVHVKSANGISGTWVKMNKASESKNVGETKIKVAAASNGTSWCTKFTDRRDTGAMKVIEVDDHDFYVFFPENSTQAALALVPIKEGEEAQLKDNQWYTGIFKRTNGCDNQIEPELYDAVNRLAVQTKDADIAHTLNVLGYSGMSKEEMAKLQRKKYAEQEIWLNAHDGNFTVDDIEDIQRLFGISLTHNGNDLILHEFNRGIYSQVFDAQRGVFWDKLFNSITTIEVDAYFGDTGITSLGNLQIIGGSVDFEGSSITSLGNLQSIRGSAFFEYSSVTSLGNLQSIGGRADFRKSGITSLGNLQSIGGNADFRKSGITSLGNLQSIGGNANFSESSITSLGNLQSIGGDANFRNSSITSLGNLQSIGVYAYFRNSSITSLGNLQSIGEGADFEGSSIPQSEQASIPIGTAEAIKKSEEIHRRVIEAIESQNTATQPSGSGIWYQFLGEQGAANLDKAEEATTRLNYLQKAREMEAAKKEPLTIKQATGWERGADWKWRYEVEDVILSERALESVLDIGTRGKKSAKMNIKDFIGEDSNILKSYPEIGNYTIVLKQTSGYGTEKGNVIIEDKIITIRIQNVAPNIENAKAFMRQGFKITTTPDVITNDVIDDTRRTLIHEIQHAIQEIEGFASGTEQSMAAIDAYYDKIKPDFTIDEERVIDWYKDYKKDSTINNPYWEQGISTDEYLSWNKKLIDKYEGYLQKVKELEGKDGIDIYSWYKRNAGEAEARNAGRRMNMTAEERRNSLAAETEDVAREDQIFIYDGVLMQAYAESEVTRSVIEAARRSGVEVIDVSDEEVSEALQQSGIEPLTDTVNSVYGYAKDGKIYLTKRGLNPNTPLHEYTHLWAKMMQFANPKEWSNIVELLKGSPVWESVVNDKDYANIRTDDNNVASEVLSRLSGTHNSQRLMDEMRSAIESAKERGDIMDAVGRHNVLMRIKEALNKFWQWVGTDLFHIKFNSIEEVTDRVLYDFVSDGGTKLENKEKELTLQQSQTKSLQESKESSNFIEQNNDDYGRNNEGNDREVSLGNNQGVEDYREHGVGSGLDDERGRRESENVLTRRMYPERVSRYSDDVEYVNQVNDALEQSLTEKGIGHTTQRVLNADAQTFHDAIAAEKKRNPKGWMVDVHSVESTEDEVGYNDCQCFLTEDGKSGIAIKPDGDIISLFSSVPHDHRMERLIPFAIAMGGRKCDCYGGGLHRLYARFGATAAAQTPFNAEYAPSDWVGRNENATEEEKKGHPIVAMTFPATAQDALDKFNKDAEVDMSLVKEFTGENGYGDMIDYRDDVLSKELEDESSSRAGGFEFFISRKGEELDEALSIPNADERLSEAGKLYAELKNAFVQDVVDSNVYLHDLVEELNSVRKDEGAEMIPLSANPYEKASNVMSSAGGKLSIYHSDYYKPMINEVRINIDALYLGSKAPYSTFEEAREAIEKYLLVKDFLERRDMGLSVEENVNAWYKEFMEESKGVTPEAFVAKIEECIDSDSLWERWGKLTQYLRDELYNSHLISKERYDEMNRRKYYVPQRTSEEFKDVENYTEHIIEKHKKVRRGIGTVEAIRKSNGTNLEAANPLEWIDFIAQNTFMQSSINEAKVSFLELFNNEHDASVLKSKGVSVRSAYVYTDSNKNGIPNIDEIEKYEEYSRYIEDVNNKKHPTEHEEEVRDRATTLRDALGIKGGYVSKGVDSNEVVVTYGNRVFVIDTGNAKLAHSLNHELSREEMSKLLKVCRKLNRLSASVLTTLNPVFAPKNFIRDVKFTIAAAFIEDPMLAARITKNLAHPNLGAISEYLWNGDFLETEDGKMFKQFISDGGSGGYTMSMDGKVDIKKRIDEELRDDMTINSAKNNVLKGLSFLSNSSELIVRYNIYRSALENGETRERALHLSKNLNVNFDIRGSHDSLFSSILFNNVLFANASVRAIVGGYRTLKNGTKSPAAIARLAGVVGFQLFKGYSSVMLMDYYARILSESLLGGDDDDKVAREEYYKTIIDYLAMLNNFDRYSYSNYTKLPLAMFTGNKDSGTLKLIEEQRLAIFSNIGASLAYYSLGYANWGDTSHKLIDDITGAILPFELSTNMESNWELLSPYRVLKAFLGNIDIGNQDEAHYLNAKYNTDELSQGCSRVLFNMFYGEDDKGKRFGDSRRGLELKPEWFKASSNLVLPSFVRNIGYLALAPMAGIQLKVTDIPFVNSLYEEQGKMLERNQYKVVSDFGNKIYKLKSDLAEIDKLDDLGKDNLAYEKMGETYQAIRDYKIALLYAESALDEYKGYDVRRQAIHNQQFMDEFLQGKPKGYAEEQAKFQRSCFFDKLLPSIIRVQDGLKVNDYFDDTNPLLK